jgi:tRNA threonylcarbamoyladenosine modification (KEOPS) complex  Pcc1 subunit
LGCNAHIAVAKFFIRKDQLLQKGLNQNKNYKMLLLKFIFTFDSNNETKIVFKSIEPEIKNKIPKVFIKASFSNKTLHLEIEAKDINSLRAASNSFLRWINTALNVKKKC